VTTRARERNDIAEIGGRALRRLVATRDQDDAVEVIGAAPIVRSRGENVAGLGDLPHCHPFQTSSILEERVPEAHLQRPLEGNAGAW
jgi:hypothetical protein